MLTSNYTSIYDNNLTLTESLNNLSLQWLKDQRGIFAFWIIDCSLNMMIAVFLLFVFHKWKIYEGDILFLTQSMLLSEILSGLSAICVAVWKIVNSFNGWSEVMTHEKCHAIVGWQVYIMVIAAWINFLDQL